MTKHEMNDTRNYLKFWYTFLSYLVFDSSFHRYPQTPLGSRDIFLNSKKVTWITMK